MTESEEIRKKLDNLLNLQKLALKDEDYQYASDLEAKMDQLCERLAEIE